MPTQVIETPHRGTCRGGPWNGQELWAELTSVPALRYRGPDVDTADLLGFYVNDGRSSVWHWHPARNPPQDRTP